MPVRIYKPTSPGRRKMSVSDFADVTKSRPERSLLGGRVTKTGGRNGYGRVTSWHRGGGHKRRYRVIDFRRNKPGVRAKVASVEYDPNRSARIALLHYADGEKRYILAPAGLRVGDLVQSGADAEIRPGNALPLANIPLGTVLHAIARLVLFAIGVHRHVEPTIRMFHRNAHVANPKRGLSQIELPALRRRCRDPR